MEKIILIGYMGCGKTTIGSALSKVMNLDFIDLDRYIELKQHMEITDIFDEKGQQYFRELETECLKEILDKNCGFILSTGGGSPCYAQNMNLMNKNGVTIYLKMEAKSLYYRLKSQKSKRPVIANLADDVLEKYIEAHLKEREIFYKKSQIIIDIENEKLYRDLTQGRLLKDYQV
ncbi:shikimate kinase [Ichthyobacterium seriolicida]|uniref:Shikimate kinase n=1 Tax=Ichthyobacterium seriolicida TaxID=242600 RepID=A0A1J1DZH4_9FLAO|nr:shikimate kinase [Ichthyobacterium seriolicida]BAV94069.1 shikimate kinase I [Ichthyobacterium seriolicida]